MEYAGRVQRCPPYPPAEGKSNKMLLQDEATKPLIPVTFITPSNRAEFQIGSGKEKAILDSNHCAGRQKCPDVKKSFFLMCRADETPFHAHLEESEAWKRNGFSLRLLPAEAGH